MYAMLNIPAVPNVHCTGADPDVERVPVPTREYIPDWSEYTVQVEPMLVSCPVVVRVTVVVTLRVTVLGENVAALGKVNGHESCIERDVACGKPMMSYGDMHIITLSPVGIVRPANAPTASIPPHVV